VDEMRSCVLYTCAAKSASLMSLVGRDLADTASRMVNTISRSVVTSSSASDQPWCVHPTPAHARQRPKPRTSRPLPGPPPLCSEKPLGVYRREASRSSNRTATIRLKTE
jgi:hypothetical protein